MTAYTLREWAKLPHGDGEGEIPEHLARRLADVARASSFAGRNESGVLEDRRTELRARGVVGVISTKECTLEILPKIDIPLVESVNHQNSAIRKRLVHMLAVALNLRIDIGAMADLDWQRETLLEILIRIFCDKLNEAVRRGLPRRYVEHEADLSALRGTLDVPRQFTRHAANPGRLACRFDDMSQDITLNHIIKASVTHLFKISRSAANQKRLREITFVYGDIADIPVSALKWEDVIIDRTNRAWQDLYGMAKLFLRSRYQTTSSGAGRGAALLFDMSALFEEYVGRLVVRALSRTPFQVSLQGGRLFCLTSLENNRNIFQTKPDILIKLDGGVTHIIDTKWKRISVRIDDKKLGVAQGDIYQMIAYAHLYGPPKLTLLYPHHVDLGPEEGVLARFKISGHDNIIEAASVDVANGQDIVQRLRDKLFQCP